jgi:hypothetical protein
MSLRKYPKESKRKLLRLLEETISEECKFPRPGLFLNINEIEPIGHPLEKIFVWATLHFTVEGSPFCCGEPGCHLGLFGERLRRVEEDITRRLRVTGPLEITTNFHVEYHEGVEFKSKTMNRIAN